LRCAAFQAAAAPTLSHVQEQSGTCGRDAPAAARMAARRARLIPLNLKAIWHKLALSVCGATVLILLAGGCTKQNSSDPRPVSGTIETDEAHVASRYGGRVEKILAQAGETLKAGQVILQLEAPELRARREAAAAGLAELEAGPRPEEIQAARNDWEALVAELEFIRSDDRRSQELFEKKAISETERDRAASRARALEKSVTAAKSRHDLLLAGTRPERIAQARGQLAEIDAQLAELKVFAPSDAVLEVLNVKTGDVLAPNREVATLLLPQHLWVRVFVPEPWLGHLKVGQSVQIRVNSYPDKTFPGEVEQINRAAEFTPRNAQTAEERIKQVFGVKVRLGNEEDRLRAGMSAEVFFPNIPAPFDTPTR
jgi:HlyD family secretion protein